MAVSSLTTDSAAQRYKPGCQTLEAEWRKEPGNFTVQSVDLNLTTLFSKAPNPSLTVPNIPKSRAPDSGPMLGKMGGDQEVTKPL